MEILISSLINCLSLYGLGKTFFYSFKKEFLINNFPFIIIIGLLISSFLSIFLNFFFPINHYITSIFLVTTSLAGIFYILKDKSLNTFLYIILISLIVFLLVFKSANVVDFGLYHAPYIGILNSEKIVIGLTNIHFRFGYSSIIQNAMAIYNIPIFFPKNYLTLTSIFFSSIYLFYFFYLIKIKNFRDYILIYFFNLFIFIFISIKVYRYNDFGNDMLSNLIIFIVWSKVLEYIFYKNNQIIKEDYNNLLILLIFSVMLATFNKLQFILGILPVSILFIKNVKFFNLNNKKIYYLFFIFIITITITTRNFLISGCIQYPIAITCSENVSWSTKNTKSISDAYYNYQKGQAWSKDWPNRILRKDNSQIKTYEEYNKIKNWFPIWIDNHFKKIIEKSTPFLLIFIFLLIFLSIKKTNSLKQKNFRWPELVLLFISILSFLCL